VFAGLGEQSDHSYNRAKCSDYEMKAGPPQVEARNVNGFAPSARPRLTVVCRAAAAEFSNASDIQSQSVLPHPFGMKTEAFVVLEREDGPYESKGDEERACRNVGRRDLPVQTDETQGGGGGDKHHVRHTEALGLVMPGVVASSWYRVMRICR
jgi:hypothetical protein